jgi:hypothetical protein
MNERTKKTPCKPENVLGNPFLSKSKPNRIPANRQTKGTTQKSGTATTELVNLK